MALKILASSQGGNNVQIGGGSATSRTDTTVPKADVADTAKHLIGDDTRGVNSPPSEYMQGGSRYKDKAGWQTEFKSTATIGINSLLSGSHCYLETKTPWIDPSGGYPIQIAYGNGTPVWRVGTSKTTWGSWQRFNDGGNASTVSGFTVGVNVPANAKFTDTVYTHPTTAGNKHIPSGGSANQILRYSASGTAVWSNENNTIYLNATASADGLMSKEDKSKLNNIEAGANNYTLPTDVVQDGSYVHTDNNFTTTEKNKLAGLSNYDDTDIINTLNNKVDNSQVLTNVPANAKFTDTVYTHPTTHPASMITESTTRRFVSDAEKTLWNAKWDYDENTIQQVKVNNAGNADTVNGKTVAVNVPANAKFTDTVYTHPTTAGNKHIPTGGASGQYLKYSASGTATWAKPTKADVGLGNVDNTSDVNKPVSTAQANAINNGIVEAKSYTDTKVANYIPLTQKGIANGLAELDATGHILSSQLPSYVDDVIEATTTSGFPTTGETGKIYVATSTNLTYRWSGTGYVEISPSLALGETSSTAYRGDRGKVAYDHSQVAHAPSNAQKNSDITKAEIEAKLTGAIASHTHAYVPTSRTVAGKALTSNITLAKGDVGLGNVDNTSDATKNSAVATLDNKTIDGGTF